MRRGPLTTPRIQEVMSGHDPGIFAAHPNLIDPVPGCTAVIDPILIQLKKVIGRERVFVATVK
jgi:hypothetical protein